MLQLPFWMAFPRIYNTYRAGAEIACIHRRESVVAFPLLMCASGSRLFVTVLGYSS
jgi:hypothetical protein